MSLASLCLLALASAVGLASAAQSTWGQCSYPGGSELPCTDGTYCKTWNDWYAQCIPGETTAPASSTSVPPATTTTPVETTSTSTTSTSSFPSQTSTPGSLRYLIAFGDSYSQTGFDYTGTEPTPEKPLGNPALPGWTASGGLNWVGFLVSQFNQTPTVAYNFAYGGATVDADLVTPYTSTVLSFEDQVDQFSASLASHPSYAPWTAQDATVAVWMGVNDIGNSFWLENIDELLVQILDRYFELLQVTYDAGARRLVLLSMPRKFERDLIRRRRAMRLTILKPSIELPS